MASKLLLKASEAADLLNVSRAHFLMLDKLGRIPAPVRLGRAVRWRRDELERWIAHGCPPRHVWEAMRE